MKYEEIISRRFDFSVARDIIKALLILPNVYKISIYYKQLVELNQPQKSFLECSNKKEKSAMASRIIIKTILLSAFMFALLLTSCDNSVDSIPSAWDQVNFENVKNGLINYQEDTVRFELNKVFSEMKPFIAADDEFGHTNNFNLFIAEFNARTASMNMELLCYSCIETNPPQSELFVKINFGGGTLTRIIDVSTPEDSSLSMIGMHH